MKHLLFVLALGAVMPLQNVRCEDVNIHSEGSDGKLGSGVRQEKGTVLSGVVSNDVSWHDGPASSAYIDEGDFLLPADQSPRYRRAAEPSEEGLSSDSVFADHHDISDDENDSIADDVDYPGDGDGYFGEDENGGEVDKRPMNMLRLGKRPMNMLRLGKRPMNMLRLGKRPMNMLRLGKRPMNMLRLGKRPMNMLRLGKRPMNMLRLGKRPMNMLRLGKRPMNMLRLGKRLDEEDEEYQYGLDGEEGNDTAENHAIKILLENSPLENQRLTKRALGMLRLGKRQLAMLRLG